MIDKNSQVPMYVQIANIIIDKIKDGDFKPGDKINTVAELVENYNVSRVTAVTALEYLNKKGHVISKRGKGSFVPFKKSTENIDKLRSLQEISEHGDSSMNQKILFYGFIHSSEMTNNVFQNNSFVLQVTRLNYSDEKPIALIKEFIPEKIGVKLTKKEMDESSIYSILDEHGYQVYKAIQIIEAQGATKEISKSLNLKIGSPILNVKRKSLDSRGDLLMYSEFYYRSDSYSFVAEMYR